MNRSWVLFSEIPEVPAPYMKRGNVEHDQPTKSVEMSF